MFISRWFVIVNGQIEVDVGRSRLSRGGHDHPGHVVVGRPVVSEPTLSLIGLKRTAKLDSVHICSPSTRLTAEDVVVSFERNRLVGEIGDGDPIGDVGAIGAFGFYAGRNLRASAGGSGPTRRSSILASCR